MARPEGYRKAERLMRHAEKFAFPLVTLIDTPGAEPGIGSEERGQATAIAESLLTMADLATPSVAVVIGEGGSGGALAIGVADRILMLENAIYAVASPEACAAILWKDAGRAATAAETMRITAADLHGFGIVDEMIAEPVPAHERPRETMQRVGAAIARGLDELAQAFPGDDPAAATRLRDARYRKFRQIGAWREAAATTIAHPPATDAAPRDRRGGNG
jgi:acetyl-CoA carboxylase carboxyl transferase subunit alpha